MSINRREFISASAIAVVGAALAACERKPSEAYLAYLDYIAQKKGKDAMPTGGEARYVVFSQEDFRRLERLVDSPLLTIEKAPRPIDYPMEKEEIASRFDSAIERIGADRKLVYENGLYKYSVRYNPRELAIVYDSQVTDSLLEWASSVPLVASAWYPGRIDHDILLGSFSRNPFYPLTNNSVTAIWYTEEEKYDWRIAKSIVNLNNPEEHFRYLNTDWALATEIMQVNLGIGGLRQEELAGSVGLAYVFAKRER
jgi:hypothetical protein